MTVTGCCYGKSPKRRRFFFRALVAILKMAEILRILKTHTYSSSEISLKSNNVEFVWYCGGYVENGDR
jgi:hypothetical protein